MRQITKRFGGVLANDQIDFQVNGGEIHALLGENGAGKTTLMNILYGLYQADEGEIYIQGQKVFIRCPKDAISLGIGMVHQHFMLIPVFTVTENVVLGMKSSREPLLDTDRVGEEVLRLAKRYLFKIEPKAKIIDLSIGEQQRVEVLKMIFRGGNALIFDEPTSVLTPPEARDLFASLRRMADEGRAIILITHKLSEALSTSDRITVLRKGKLISTVFASETNKKELAKMMVGREVMFGLSKSPVETGGVILEVKGLHALDNRGLLALRDISFSVRGGEILGIAGVAGNGQSELAEVLVGLRKATQGIVCVERQDVTNLPPRLVQQRGVACIPEDRIELGLVMSLRVWENAILDVVHSVPFSEHGLLNSPNIDRYVDDLLTTYDVRTRSKLAQTSTLSGGNLQKIILARKLSLSPKVLIACQPTRGLDVGATEYVHQKILEQKNLGRAVLLISDDLDEILSLSDNIAVMYNGEIVRTVPAAETSAEEIGLMMFGVKEKD